MANQDIRNWLQPGFSRDGSVPSIEAPPPKRQRAEEDTEEDTEEDAEQGERTSHRFTGKPQVSSFGRFTSSFGVIYTPKPTKSGYIEVKINGKHHQIHRLIAIAFGLPKEDDQDTVNHKDKNPSNNRLENLEWANMSEQVNHSYATNKNRGSHVQRTSKPVEGRELGTEAWVSYASSAEAARKLGVNKGHISACCNGKQKKTGNYEFRWGVANEVDVLEGEVWRDVIICA